MDALRARGVSNVVDDIDAPRAYERRIELLYVVRRHEEDALLAGSNTIEVDGEELILMSESEIFAVVE